MNYKHFYADGLSRCWLLYAVVVMMSLVLSSCGSGDEDEPAPQPTPKMIWDFAPYDVVVKIMDTEGTNLLNPGISGHWMKEPFRMTFNGDDYPVNWSDYLQPGICDVPGMYHAGSRAVPAIFSGLRCLEDTYWNGEQLMWHKDEYVLAFGAFPSNDNHEIEMEFHVPNQSISFRIKVQNSFRWKSENEPDGDTEIWLDDVKINAFPIEIILPRFQRPLD